jgi:hypothetical protein
MPSLKCPWPECFYSTPEDADYKIGISLLQLHKEAVHTTMETTMETTNTVTRPKTGTPGG